MGTQALAENVDTLRPRTARAISPFGGLFILMMLVSTYDKSGIPIGIGGRVVSVTIYKLMFVVLALSAVADLLMRRPPARVAIDRGLLKLIVAFVLVQTWASLVGGLITPGGIPVSAEIYYFIQRAHLVFIPLIALKVRLSPRSVLVLFFGAVLIHYAFVALQFISSSAYGAFVEAVADPLRRDNSLGWTGESVDFIGLQRTGHYGAFVAAFGLLALGFCPRRRHARRLVYAVAWLAVTMAVLFSSRAVFIMATTGLLVFWMKTKVLSKLQISLALGALATVVVGGILFDELELSKVPALYAFVDPERNAEGGEGKLLILANSPHMVARSPVFGWGQRRFADIADTQGLGDVVAEVSHFYFLSVLLSSGVIGLLAEIAATVAIARALWRRKEREYAIMCAVFVGVGIHSLLYDAGHLDVFACFNGTAAYWALRSVGPKTPNGGGNRMPL